jgi:hypothetical protein
MGVAHLHAPTPLPTGPTEWESINISGEDKNLLSLPGIKTRIVHPLASSLKTKANAVYRRSYTFPGLSMT